MKEYKYLLEYIEKLENDILEFNEKESKLKKVVINLKKFCTPIIETNIINNSIKEKINKFLTVLYSNLEEKELNPIYKEGCIRLKNFLDITQNFNFSKHYLFIFKLKNSNDINFAISFLKTKFTPLLSTDSNRIIGIITKETAKEFEKLKNIPYFQKSEYKDLNFFVTFFEIENLDETTLKRVTNIFDRFIIKPSFEEKHYVYYSLKFNKIIDFEAIEKEKVKKEYSFIEDMTYPQIEILVRKEIKNIKLILALLDRIDNELKEIKKSHGTIIVVKRILSFIHKNQLDKTIQEMVELLSKELE